ncbi:hypothetical protein ACVFI8_12840 [Agarivorans sp. MS3-6]
MQDYHLKEAELSLLPTRRRRNRRNALTKIDGSVNVTTKAAAHLDANIEESRALNSLTIFQCLS